ncbi:hypothetical protein PHET_07104 [Paragonimus heterotremus]|uniref:FZ domain-containing protein n=1 Tax=Paragonimus heterotremus TaxID=100268 RepID=A0A8J4WGU4_9TREM|nr:hypothetical protein PHET_07104 [Paragonimus heterotremus]
MCRLSKFLSFIPFGFSGECTTDAPYCVPIPSHTNHTCLGNRLPYEWTAPFPLEDDVSRYRLDLWTALRVIPACWDKLQFFLCSIYVPECVDQRSPSSAVHNKLFGGFKNTTTLDASKRPIGAPPILTTVNFPMDVEAVGSPRYRIVRPEAEMCEAVHKACPLLVSSPSASSSISELPLLAGALLHPLPKFLNCSLYTPGCRQNSLTARLFQSTGGGCEAPLVTTVVHRNWLPGLDRCSFPCRRPHFDPEHYTLVRWITGIAATVCLLVNIVVLISLRLQRVERAASLLRFDRMHGLMTGWDQDSSVSLMNSYQKPSRGYARHPKGVHSAHCWSLYYPLVYIHFFFLLGCLGWLMPLMPRWGEFIACREDHSIRTGEPQVGSGKVFLCVVNFIVIYFSIMAVAIWSNILDYILFVQTRHLYSLVTQVSTARLCCVTKSPNTVCQPDHLSSVVDDGQLGHKNSADPCSKPSLLDCSENVITSNESPVNLTIPTTSEETEDPLGKLNHTSQLLTNTHSDQDSAAHINLTAVSNQALDNTLPSCPSIVHIRASDDPAVDQSDEILDYLDPPKPLIVHAYLTSFRANSNATANRTGRQSKHVSKSTGDSATFPNSVVKMSPVERSTRSRPVTVSAFPNPTCSHLLAFALPLVFILISLTTAEIDGDSLSGICFIGRVNFLARLGLVFLPCTVCLLLKVFYLGRLIRLFRQLRCRFSESTFRVDQEFAQRFARCTHSYVVFLVTIMCIWLFSFSLQLYVFLSEPSWMESQRALVLCQISHRLMGVDEPSARKACLSLAAPVVGFPQSGFFHLTAHTRLPRSVVGNATSSSDRSLTAPSSHHDRLPILRSSPAAKPMMGPIFLQFFVYFALNLIATSSCLFDQSVKICWRNVWMRGRGQKQSDRSTHLIGTNSNAACNLDDFLLTHYDNLATGFSWWDPGIFNPPLSCTVDSLICACDDSQLNGNQAVHYPEASSVHIPISGVLASTAETAVTTVHLSHCSESAAKLSTTIFPGYEDIITQLGRLISVYESPSHDDPNLLLFRHLYQQLVNSSTVADVPPSTCPGVPEASRPPSDNTSTIQPSHSGFVPPPSDPLVDRTMKDQPDWVASMAALYEQCQKRLASLTGVSRLISNRRRSRHRRVFPSRTSVRRRSQSRSLSTTGLFFQGLSPSGPSSTVSGTRSDKPAGNVTDESLSLLHAAAASVVAAASSIQGSRTHSNNPAHSHRLSQSGVTDLSIHQFDLSSGTGSAFGGSQISSSSVRSTLPGIHIPTPPPPIQPQAVTTCPADCLTSKTGQSAVAKSSDLTRSSYAHPATFLEDVGSRLSLRSQSCASSSGAESYNSYRLLVNQAGASWRELWRTRMLLMDVLKWAEAVAPLMQINRKSRTSLSDIDGHQRATTETSTLNRESSGSQETEPTMQSEWNTAFSNLVTSLVAQQRQNQHEYVTRTPVQGPTVHPDSLAYGTRSTAPGSTMIVPTGIPAPSATLDPVMAAAFAAATAAATVALQQQQRRLQHLPEITAFTSSPSCFLSSLPADSGLMQAESVPPQVVHTMHVHACGSVPVCDSSSVIGPRHAPMVCHPPIGTTSSPLWPPTGYIKRGSLETVEPPCDYYTICPSQHRPDVSPFVQSALIGFRGPPDLLADHDRSQMNKFSPNYTPSFVGSPSASQTPIFYAPTQSISQQFYRSFSPPTSNGSTPVQWVPAHMGSTINSRIPHSYDSTVRAEQGRNSTTPTDHERFVSERESAELHPDANDSDAFDSEDEVMSQGEAALELSHMEPLAPVALDSDSITPFIYPVDPATLPGYLLPTYPSYPPLRFCHPNELCGSVPIPMPDTVAHSDSPSCLPVDDGDLSSVSQSASQVAPRESSPSSSEADSHCAEPVTMRSSNRPHSRPTDSSAAPHRTSTTDFQ